MAHLMAAAEQTARVDHHFVHPETGKKQRSPPKNMTAMYDYLPTGAALYKIPAKVSVEGAINSLKQQSHALGTYVRIDGREAFGAPIYKHATADLVLAKSKTVGEDGAEEGWVISRWATFTVGGSDQRCMYVISSGMPWFGWNDGKWLEWSGRKWVAAESVKLRPSYHGHGAGTGDHSVHNIFTACDEVRRRSVSPGKGRSRGRSASPPKSPGAA